MNAGGDEAPEPGETLQEAEQELGLADWVDADTGELAEGTSHAPGKTTEAGAPQRIAIRTGMRRRPKCPAAAPKRPPAPCRNAGRHRAHRVRSA